eukprot:jgi/Orpsp1_1/1177914/evm.model.c7180000063304.2
MISSKTKEISDDKLFDFKELDQLDSEKLKVWYNGYLNYVINQYMKYKSLTPIKRTKARKKLMLTNFRNLIKNFIYKLEKVFAIKQLIKLIELFIIDEELIKYAESMLFRPVEIIYNEITEKTEELTLLYERLKMDNIYIRYYTAFQNNSLQIGSVHQNENNGGTMGGIMNELKNNIKGYIKNNDSKEKIFLSLLRVKQINDSLCNSANDKVNKKKKKKKFFIHLYINKTNIYTVLL